MFFLTVVNQNATDACSIQIHEKDQGVLLASFMQHYYDCKMMISEGESYEKSKAVYLAGFEEDNDGQTTDGIGPDSES